MRPAYYNEIDTYCAAWLQNLMDAGLIPRGHIDTRSIADVSATDLVGYGQCHFFAGIGGWALAARLAGWPDDLELWTGSCPCQPFSVAGKGKGHNDDRHLWPHQLRLIRDRRPARWMGEQVAAAVGKAWLDGVLADLEGIGYAGRAVVVPACSVDAPHRRDRLWLVADTDNAGLEGLAGDVVRAAQGRSESLGSLAAAGVLDREAWGSVADADHERRAREHALLRAETSGRDANGLPEAAGSGTSSFWDSASWVFGHDGKARRVEPSILLLAHGISARVGRLRAYGNAIVPPLAAEVIGAYLDCMPSGVREALR